MGVLAVAFVSEMWGVLTGHTDATISNVEWTMAGDRYGPRWWIVTPIILGLMSWAMLHFAWGGQAWGWKQLLVMLAGFLLVAQGLRLVAA